VSALVTHHLLEDQAEYWLIRLSSDQANQEDVQQFALWLAEGDQQRRCFDQVFEDWKTLGVVRELF
jgi:ferric-dicitrate binding protein FerR (iron transport regulator)